MKKERSDKIKKRKCECCEQLFDSKYKYGNHFKRKGSTCFRPSEMKRIFESIGNDREETNYNDDKKGWMKTFSTTWNRNNKNGNYYFEDVLGDVEWTAEKPFFNKFSDELNEQLRY